MQIEELVEAAARRMAVADGQNPDKLSHNSFEWWRHYVPMARAAIEAALSAAEPIATVAEMGAGGMRVLMPHPPGSTDHLPIGTKLYAISPSLSAQVQDVAGWQLVPKEPTQEMLDAFRIAETKKRFDIMSAHPTEEPEAGGGTVGYGYRAMLAAAPAKQEG